MMLKELIIIRNQRSGDYGSPTDQMTTFANLVNARFGTSFTGADMCIVEMLHKISRTKKKYKKDHFMDIAGYADCAVEINERNSKKRPKKGK